MLSLLLQTSSHWIVFLLRVSSKLFSRISEERVTGPHHTNSSDKRRKHLGWWGGDTWQKERGVSPEKEKLRQFFSPPPTTKSHTRAKKCQRFPPVFFFVFLLTFFSSDRPCWRRSVGLGCGNLWRMNSEALMLTTDDRFGSAKRCGKAAKKAGEYSPADSSRVGRVSVLFGPKLGMKKKTNKLGKKSKRTREGWKRGTKNVELRKVHRVNEFFFKDLIIS